uniref:Pex19 protein n=1 Tax=Arcella intermedia TaxID=1963864 RepID=A0A6B2LH38_9EUKA
MDDIINGALDEFDLQYGSSHFPPSQAPSQPSSTSTSTSTPPPSGSTPSSNIDWNSLFSSMKSSTPEAAGGNEDNQFMEQMFKDFDSNQGYHGLMQTMMKQLLSKDVLYEPMKEMRDKYPAWLKEKKDSLPKDQWEKYLLQFQHIEEILYIYEKEGEEGFEKILKLMKEMQECGHVPPEIVKQLAPEVEFDEEGQPKFAGMDNDLCSIM